MTAILRHCYSCVTEQQIHQYVVVLQKKKGQLLLSSCFLSFSSTLTYSLFNNNGHLYGLFLACRDWEVVKITVFYIL